MPRPSPDQLRLLRQMLAQRGIRSTATEAILPRADREVAPLSSAQERLWFLEQFDPGTCLYNDCLTLRIRTHNLEVELLRRAWEEVVRRHEALRTSFHLDGTRPLQRIHEAVRLPFRVEDLRHYPDVAGTLETMLLQDVREPFLLDEAPLFNAILFRTDDDEWVFALTSHHIVSDGVSYGVIYREMEALYDALRQRVPSPLPPVPLHFGDYAAWERERLDGTDWSEDLAFWRQYLRGPLPRLTWPARPAEPSHEGECLRFELSPPLRESLESFCRTHQLTTNWVLLSSYFTLLHTLGGDEDLRVGVPSSARTRSELQDVIGFFVRTLVLRVRLDGDPTFLEVVERIRSTALEVSQHEEVPFERIVQTLREDEPDESAPLIQAWFAHMKDLITPMRIEGAETSYEIVDGKNARFELSLILDESASSLSGFFEYDTAIFTPSAVADMVDRFKTLLQKVVEAPETRLSGLRAVLGPPVAARETSVPGSDGQPSGRKKLSLTPRRGAGRTGSTHRSTGQEAWVDVQPLVPGKAIPRVIRPKLNGLDLVEWTRNNRGYVDELLAEHHALLFRGFQSGGIEGFRHFVEAASDGERLEYKDRSTPRNSYGDRIYNATVYPADQTIRLHNEGTYWKAWARKIFFASITPAASGGETPIADVHRVYRWIDPKIRREFEDRGVLYVRNFNNGLGLTWQEVFQTEDPAEVERYCQENDIEFEWKGEGRLRTRQRRPAVRNHPVTGEPLWFNHAAFFHVSALQPELRDLFLSELGEEELPYNTYFGDGGEIFPEVVAHILTCYEREKVVFPWEEGDVALYDNMRIAHGREPYQGERLTLVAMTEVHRESDGLRQTG